MKGITKFGITLLILTMIIGISLLVIYSYANPGTPPIYSQNSTTTPYAGGYINHSLMWNDTIGLSGYIFQFGNSFYDKNLMSETYYATTNKWYYWSLGYYTFNNLFADWVNNSISAKAITGSSSEIGNANGTWVFNITSNTTKIHYSTEMNIVYDTYGCAELFSNPAWYSVGTYQYNYTNSSWVVLDFKNYTTGGSSCACNIVDAVLYNTSDFISNLRYKILVQYLTGPECSGSGAAGCSASTCDGYSYSSAMALLSKFNYTTNFNYTNTSWTPMIGTGNWSNISAITSTTLGQNVRWCVYANNSGNDWNGTSCINPFTYTSISAYPLYSSNSTNNSYVNKTTLFSLKWTPALSLSHYIFSYDSGNGSFYNDTPTIFTTEWSNVTKTLNSTVNSTIRWCVYANDTATSNSWNSTSCVEPFSLKTVTTAPTYSDSSINSTIGGLPIEHRLKWTYVAGVNLSGYIFSFDNGTGEFYNDSWVEMSGLVNWSNVTKVANITPGSIIRWKVYANNTENYWSESSTYTYTIPSVGCDVYIMSLPYNMTLNNTKYCLPYGLIYSGGSSYALQFGDELSWYIQNSSLDCKGYSIVASSGGWGIYAYEGGSGFGYTRNLTIKNCNISGFTVGVNFKNGVYYSKIANNTFSNNYFSIYMWNWNLYNLIKNNTFYLYNSPSQGIQQWSSSGNNITNNSFYGLWGTPYGSSGVGCGDGAYIGYINNNNFYNVNNPLIFHDMHNQITTYNTIINSTIDGVTFDGAEHHIFANNTLTTYFVGDSIAIIKSTCCFSHSNNIINNTINNFNESGIAIRISQTWDNIIEYGSIYSKGVTYSVESGNYNNLIRQTNFTGSRSIYLDSSSNFIYSNNGSMYLYTSVSSPSTISRTIYNWRQDYIRWFDYGTYSTLFYNITDLLPWAIYDVYDNSIFKYQIITDFYGDTDTFNVSSSLSHNMTISYNSTIPRFTPTININLNSVSGNIEIPKSTTINVTGWVVSGDNESISLYKNGSLIQSGYISLINISTATNTGYYNYTLYYAGGENYTSSTISAFATIFGVNIFKMLNLSSGNYINSFNITIYNSTLTKYLSTTSGNITINSTDMPLGDITISSMVFGYNSTIETYNGFNIYTEINRIYNISQTVISGLNFRVIDETTNAFIYDWNVSLNNGTYEYKFGYEYTKADYFNQIIEPSAPSVGDTHYATATTNFTSNRKFSWLGICKSEYGADAILYLYDGLNNISVYTCPNYDNNFSWVLEINVDDMIAKLYRNQEEVSSIGLGILNYDNISLYFWTVRERDGSGFELSHGKFTISGMTYADDNYVFINWYNIPEGSTRVSVTQTSYYQRIYYINNNPYTRTTLIARLSDACFYKSFMVISASSLQQSVIPNSLVSLYRLYLNGTFSVVAQEKSNEVGTLSICVAPLQLYRITASASGFNTLASESQTFYNDGNIIYIALVGQPIISNVSTALDGITVRLMPTAYYILNDTPQNFTCFGYASNSNLQWVWFNISYTDIYNSTYPPTNLTDYPPHNFTTYNHTKTQVYSVKEETPTGAFLTHTISANGRYDMDCRVRFTYNGTIYEYPRTQTVFLYGEVTAGSLIEIGVETGITTVIGSPVISVVGLIITMVASGFFSKFFNVKSGLIFLLIFGFILVITWAWGFSIITLSIFILGVLIWIALLWIQMG